MADTWCVRLALETPGVFVLRAKGAERASVAVMATRQWRLPQGGQEDTSALIPFIAPYKPRSAKSGLAGGLASTPAGGPGVNPRRGTVWGGGAGRPLREGGEGEGEAEAPSSCGTKPAPTPHCFAESPPQHRMVNGWGKGAALLGVAALGRSRLPTASQGDPRNTGW